MELKTQLIKICCEGCEDKSCNENCPDYKYIELVLAEFDITEKSRQAFIKILDETMLENEELQSWLDRLKAENERIKNAPVARLYLEAVADRVELSTKLHQAQSWLDKISAPKKAIKKPPPQPKCEHKNGGISYYCEGGMRQWCGDCKEWFVPKSLTQCPECRGTRQKRISIWKESSLHNLEPDYVIYERCPRCKGQGVI